MLQAAMAGVAQHDTSTVDPHAGADGGAALVGHVLSDALSGGANGKPDVESLLHAMGSTGHWRGDLVDALAMAGPHEGFATGPHGLPIAEALVLHAAPAHG
jgi:hypothetical protein